MTDARVNTSPLIDLDLLTYYDGQIKQWVINRINDAKDTSIVFLDKDSFPVIGKMDTLYVNKDGLYLWDQNNSSYIAISNPNENIEDLVWGSF